TGLLEEAAHLVGHDAAEAEAEEMIRPALLIATNELEIAVGDLGEGGAAIAAGHIAEGDVRADDAPVAVQGERQVLVQIDTEKAEKRRPFGRASAQPDDDGIVEGEVLAHAGGHARDCRLFEERL